jgi:hypothetical protein
VVNVFVERLSCAGFWFFPGVVLSEFPVGLLWFLFERRWGKCLQNVLLSSRG